MKRKGKTAVAKLLLVLALIFVPCTVLVPAQVLAASENVSFTSVTVKKTKLYKTKDMKDVLMKIPKGKSVTVIRTNVSGCPNAYKVKYKKTTGYVYIENLLDSESPVQSRGSMGTYDSSATSSPLFYVKAKRDAAVVSSPSGNGSKKGVITRNTVLGVYGKTNGYYEVSFAGERYYSNQDSFKKADPDGTILYVSSVNGARLRYEPIIPYYNERVNVFEVLLYRSRATVLSKIYNDGYIWYKVLAQYKNKYYIEGYVRSDVVDQSPDAQVESEGSNRIIENGTMKKSVIRDAPNGNQITSLPNGTKVFATGEIRHAGGRNWARITSPVSGWIAASHIGFAR